MQISFVIIFNQKANIFLNYQKWNFFKALSQYVVLRCQE